MPAITPVTERMPTAEAHQHANVQTFQGRVVTNLNSQNSIWGQVAMAVMAIALGTTAVALAAIMTTASIFMTMSLVSVSPLTLIGTIPLSFALMRITIESAVLPLLQNTASAWQQVFVPRS